MSTTRQEHEAADAHAIARRIRELRLLAGQFATEADRAQTAQDRQLAQEAARLLAGTAKLARACMDRGVPSGFVVEFLDAHLAYVVGGQ